MMTEFDRLLTLSMQGNPPPFWWSWDCAVEGWQTLFAVVLLVLLFIVFRADDMERKREIRKEEPK